MTGAPPRALLVSISDDLNPGPTLPVALAVLKSFLESEGIETRTLDLFFEDDRADAVRRAVAELQPDVVGISIKYVRFDHSRTGSTPAGVARLVAAAAREVSRAPVVLGGAGFSTAPEYFLEEVPVRYGIVGDGEVALRDFVRAVQAGEEPGARSIGGLVWRDERGRVRRHRRATVADLTALPEPDRDVFDRRYLDFHGVLPINGVQTCRGCSKRCIMCTIGQSEGKRERPLAVEQVVSQIRRDAARGFEGFYVADTIFNRPIEHAHAVCDAFIAHGIRGPWSATVTPEGMTLELAEKMKRTGCRLLAIGADAAEPTMLRNLQKDFTVDDLVGAVRSCSAVGIPAFVTLWLGGPGETIQTIERAFDLVDSIHPDMLLLYYGIQIFPGTKLARIARDEGHFRDDRELIEPVYYESRELSREQFFAWYAQRYKTFKRIILKTGERESISIHPASAQRIGPLIFTPRSGDRQ